MTPETFGRPRPAQTMRTAGSTTTRPAGCNDGVQPACGHCDRHQRQAGVSRLVRNGARGPIAESRLARRDDGRYAYETKKGVTLVLSAEQLVRRLIALIPP